jgi:NAD(P)-dependent dehydrogenase (short-subunit alcohol dehydrogenase family)
MNTSFRDLFSLDGKVALVTGASRGIGEAIARGLAAFGGAVVLSSRRPEHLEPVAESIRQAGGRADAVAAHVGDPAALRQLVDKTRGLNGRLDVLINNAATNPVFGPLLDSTPEAFDKILAVNLKGPLELAKLCYPLLSERGGSVINVGSTAGLRPEPGLGLYSASKAGLIHLSKALAVEWAAAGVRVNVICPGLIQTKFSAALWQDEARLKRFLKAIPLGRIGQPEEIVGLAVFLASEAGRFCTGGVYVADGGQTV